MVDKSSDEATLAALLHRFTTQRLPRAEALKHQLESGEPITDYDIKYLLGLMEEVGGIQRVIDGHPDYEDLAGRVAALYKSIADLATKNEPKI